MLFYSSNYGIIEILEVIRKGKKGKHMELKFEWDEEKDHINRKKHGISFETASYVFRDEYYIEMYDFEHSM